MAQVLQQAATVTTAQDGSYEMLDYVISLREGIMDAWGGIILGLKAGGKSKSIYPLTFIDIGRDRLTGTRSTAHAVCRVDIPAVEHCLE